MVVAIRPSSTFSHECTLHHLAPSYSGWIPNLGGERQRLVAARTFTRFNLKKVKIVAVDEPSSALDFWGE
ncbi:hypothetical protein PM082_006528 [Marasmius tenuissimus]|nr:hypothetical protein PM082_006528 [Marasmius tenuissimus]